MRDLFVEVVVAPRFAHDALAIFQEKKNIRVVTLPFPPDAAGLDFKRLRGGFLVQDRFQPAGAAGWKVATRRAPTEDEWRDLRFAMETPDIACA
jgi:phosphoribosylaminoimidazolecarboxamide formyltransferase/IMP cyclohydrolase